MSRRWFIIFILIIIAIPALPVQAHANLQRSEPSANARLDAAPQEIRLFFTESLEPQFSTVELRDTQGETLDLPQAQLDPNDDKQLILIPGDLEDGLYTVVWHVVSTTDGHFTQGSFPIIIGSGNFGGASATSVEDEGIPFMSGAIRWYNLFSMAWLVGSAAFWLFIWLPTVADRHPELAKHLRDFNWLAWESVGLSTILILLLQAQIVSGGGGLELLNTMPVVVIGTRFGSLWIARVLLWLIFGIILWRAKQSSNNVFTILLLIGACILITQSLFSHASGTEDAVPSVVADWMHLLAMAIWIGGLIQFVLVIGAIKETNRLAAMVARFSNMARVCVAILIISGVYAAWLHVGSLNALFTTAYGQALVVKLVLFLPLLASAAINLVFTHRGLQAGHNIWSKRLRYLVTVEVALTVAILLAVGVMTAIVPARTAAAERDMANAAPITADNTFFQMAYDSDVMIHFTIEPGVVGENIFTVDLYDLVSGNQITDASLIRIRFDNDDPTVGESELRIEALTGGRYTVSGANLSASGTWRVRLTIQRPNQFDSVVDFIPDIIVPAAEAAPFDPAPDSASRSTVLMLTGIIGVIVCGLFVAFIRPTALNPQTIMTVIFAVGSLLLVQSGISLNPGNISTANPIPVSEESLARGEEIFMRNCSQCHGVTGLGDGPVGLTLTPPPANLTLHTVPGLHTDGELFTWISNGISSSAMPAFSTVLTEEERWTVINYIRTLGQQD